MYSQVKFQLPWQTLRDLTYMWNLKAQINKPEIKQKTPSSEAEVGKMGEGVTRYRLTAIK